MLLKALELLISLKLDQKEFGSQTLSDARTNIINFRVASSQAGLNFQYSPRVGDFTIDEYNTLLQRGIEFELPFPGSKKPYSYSLSCSFSSKGQRKRTLIKAGFQSGVLDRIDFLQDTVKSARALVYGDLDIASISAAQTQPLRAECIEPAKMIEVDGDCVVCEHAGSRFRVCPGD